MLFHRNDAPADDNASQQRPKRDFDQPTDAGVLELYAGMRPDQRTAIAGEFMRLFRMSGDPGAQQLDRPLNGLLSAEQVAQLHIYARDHLPNVLSQVREHPVTQAALAHPGEPAPPPSKEEEEAMQEAMLITDQDQTERTTPTYGSGGMMSEVELGRTGELFHREPGMAVTPEGWASGGGAEVLERTQQEGPPDDRARRGTPGDDAGN